MIKTIENEHSYNMDELLTYLCREMENRKDLAIANFARNKERSERERKMSDYYNNMYQAALFYRKQHKTVAA